MVFVHGNGGSGCRRDVPKHHHGAHRIRRFTRTEKRCSKRCSADEKTTNGPEVCKDYIGGVIDTISSNRDTIQGYQICWPKVGPDLSELRIMFVKHMHNHPEYSEGSAASVVDSMLFEA